MDRRQFLASAALGGTTIVGASALGGLDAESAFAATPSLDPAISKTSFCEGRISTIRGSMLYADGSHGEHHRIQATNATSVWKVDNTTIEAAEVGDGLYARGVVMPDGSIAADAIWLNIVNLYCTVKGIGASRLEFAHGSHRLVGRILPGRTVASGPDTATPTRDLSRIRIGQPAQVLGAWRPADDSVDVVRLWLGH